MKRFSYCEQCRERRALLDSPDNGLYVTRIPTTKALVQTALIPMALVALVFSTAVPAWSQDTARVAVGARVRVKPVGADQRWISGQLLHFRVDTLRMRTADPVDSVTMTTDSLVGFQFSRGIRKQTGRGAAIGAGIGVVAGVALGAVTYDNCADCITPSPGVGGAALLGGVLLGLVGLGLGTVVGMNVEGESWESVPRPWLGQHSGP